MLIYKVLGTRIVKQLFLVRIRTSWELKKTMLIIIVKISYTLRAGRPPRAPGLDNYTSLNARERINHYTN